MRFRGLPTATSSLHRISQVSGYCRRCFEQLTLISGNGWRPKAVEGARYVDCGDDVSVVVENRGGDTTGVRDALLLGDDHPNLARGLVVTRENFAAGANSERHWYPGGHDYLHRMRRFETLNQHSRIIIEPNVQANCLVKATPQVMHMR